MITSVSGRVARVGLDHVVVEVGGVGLLVHTTPATASAQRAGGGTALATSLVVREDSLTLYGFTTAQELATFELVQTVSGVGPRLALAMLAVLTPAVLQRAVTQGQITTLTKVPGIGRKGAERLVLELRDKVAAIAPEDPSAREEDAQDAAPVTAPAGMHAWRTPVTEALVGLGWTSRQAEAGVERVAAELGEDPDVALALRAALRELGR